MKILINGTEDTHAYLGKSAGAVLEEIIQSKVFGGTFISHLKIDGKDTDVNSRDLFQILSGSINLLEIEVSSLSSLITKNIANAEEYLQKLIPGIQKASELFHTGNEQEANKFFLKIIDGIDWFSQVVETVLKIIGDNGESLCLKNKTVLERKQKIMALLTQMVEASKNKDWVLLADLLEYEILPYYSEWQLVLPELRQAGLDKVN